MIEITTVGCPFDSRCEWMHRFVDIPTLDRVLSEHKQDHLVVEVEYRDASGRQATAFVPPF